MQLEGEAAASQALHFRAQAAYKCFKRHSRSLPAPCSAQIIKSLCLPFINKVLKDMLESVLLRAYVSPPSTKCLRIYLKVFCWFRAPVACLQESECPELSPWKEKCIWVLEEFMCIGKSFLTVATIETSLLNWDILQQLPPSHAWVDTASILKFQIFSSCKCSFHWSYSCLNIDTRLIWLSNHPISYKCLKITDFVSRAGHFISMTILTREGLKCSTVQLFDFLQHSLIVYPEQKLGAPERAIHI